jgi:two-component system, chemotaxis family, protein-glutamate methylesterase/glutaminase
VTAGLTRLRVLICDGSHADVAALQRTLEYDGDIAVSGVVCATAEQAMSAVQRARPDLVTMDIELPGRDGVEAVEEIMSSRPLPILVLSAHVGRYGDRAGAALDAGALDALAKEDIDLRDPASAAGAAFRERIRMLGRARVIKHPRARPAGPGAPRRASVIGICASTGGPQVLARLLEALPADYPIPMLIVQHLSAGFSEGLARWLGQIAHLRVGIAAPGTPAAPGAWLARPGAHLTLTATGRLALDRHAQAGHHRPSGDVLLTSIAVAAGRTGVAVVLTGIGRDGAYGAAAVQRCGGLAIAQDEQSSAVFGMPRAALELGVEVAASPAEIAACLLGLRHEPLRRAR